MTAGPIVPAAMPDVTEAAKEGAERDSEVAKDNKPSKRQTGISGIRADLFHGPSMPEPNAPPVRMPLPTVTSIASTSLLEVDPLADAVFVGSVTVNGQTLALIESRSTHDGEYVAVGGDWHGLEVTAISHDNVAFGASGGNRRLAVSDFFTVTPLNSSAPVPPAPEQIAAESSYLDEMRQVERLEMFRWMKQEISNSDAESAARSFFKVRALTEEMDAKRSL